LNTFILLAAVAGAHPIEPVVVTATRTEIPASQALASVELITGDELLRLPASDLGDALRLRAGVEVARLGGPGQQTSLFLRGTESNHVLVLVDGLRINPGTIGSAAIQNIAPELVERIEIVKGPRSTLYGSEALGGVINVITRRGAANGASVQAGFGDYDTRSASLSAGLSGARGDASIGVSWLDSDGFPTRSGDETDRGYENRSLTAAARTDLGAVEFGFRAWHAEGTSEYSDFFVTPVDQDFENSALALTAAFAPAESWDARLMLGYAVDDLEQNQSPDFLDTERYTLDWQNDVAVGRQPLDRGCPVAGGRGRGRILRPALRCHDHDEAALPAGPGDFRRASPAPRRRVYRPRDFRRSHDVERGIRLCDRRARPRHLRRRHGLPRAGCDRPVRFRRQPGAGSRGIGELRGQLPPAHRRAPVVHADGIPERHRRADPVRRHRPRDLRGREPERRARAHRRPRCRLALRRRGLVGARERDAAGPTR
jgi:hypothetical protein